MDGPGGSIDGTWYDSEITAEEDGRAGGVGGSGVDEHGHALHTTDEPLTNWQNHVRHEIGHAVGARGPTSGDDQTKRWGGWQDSSAEAMRSALFSGSGAVELGGVQVPAEAVAEWATFVIARGREPRSGDRALVSKLPGEFFDRLDAVMASELGSQPLLQYLSTIAREARALDRIPNRAFRFPGFDPPGDRVHVFTERGGRGFKTYDRAAYEIMRDTHAGTACPATARCSRRSTPPTTRAASCLPRGTESTGRRGSAGSEEAGPGLETSTKGTATPTSTAEARRPYLHPHGL